MCCEILFLYIFYSMGGIFMAICFDEALRTGNELIDSQHQELIARVNKLEECKPGTEKVVAAQVLGFLLDYTNKHFADEEALQIESDYPLLDAHKAQHASFVKAVEELEDMLVEEEGPSEAFVAAVKSNIVDWLLNHILVWDKQVAQFVKQN
jgi:hemerythrin